MTSESGTKERGWSCYETLWEHKTSGEDKESDDDLCRLMVRAVQALRDCKLRDFIITVLVQGHKFRPIIVDQQANIVQDTAIFIQFVATLLFVNRQNPGYYSNDIPENADVIPLLVGDCQLLIKIQKCSPRMSHTRLSSW